MTTMEGAAIGFQLVLIQIEIGVGLAMMSAILFELRRRRK